MQAPLAAFGYDGGAGPRAPATEEGPADWSQYFEHETVVHVPSVGGAFQTYSSGNDGPLVVFLHGAGFSGLSFALVSKALHRLVRCRTLAIDMRHHGKTVFDTPTPGDRTEATRSQWVTIDDDSESMTLDTLAGDIEGVVASLYGSSSGGGHVVVVGHSMGGALAVRLASQMKVAMVVVIDLVETTALAGLPNMRGVLERRPKRFDTLEESIEWAVKTRYINNLESARVSMPSQLTKESFSRPPTATGNGHGIERAAGYVWRTPLLMTERFWEGWFVGLGDAFLGLSVPTILVLPTLDRLDSKLTVAQMQGKFQLQVIPKAGHCVHEDRPHELAKQLGTILQRHNLAAPLE